MIEFTEHYRSIEHTNNELVARGTQTDRFSPEAEIAIVLQDKAKFIDKGPERSSEEVAELRQQVTERLRMKQQKHIASLKKKAAEAMEKAEAALSKDEANA